MLVIKHQNDEFEFRFTRRRYGSTTYTWAELRYGDDWLGLGDPWPCITPARRELVESALLAIEEVQKQARV